jgi:tetratricopeptide (TPR) repeat protein
MERPDEQGASESAREFERLYHRFFPELGPDRIVGATRVGMNYLRQGDFEAAIAWGRRATRSSQPDSAEARRLAHALLGEALRRRAVTIAEAGDLARAEAAFREATRESPSHLPLWINFAELLEASGRGGEAAQVWAEVLRRDPANVAARARVRPAAARPVTRR